MHELLTLLQDMLIPIFRARRLSWFLQDSAPCHASKSTRAFLTKENISVLPWPGNSPDLNPIENLWEHMKKKVAEKEPSSLVDLKNKILEVWTLETSSEACETLARSMPRRIAAVTANNCYPSMY